MVFSFQVVADNLPTEQIDAIKQLFYMMDTDKNGDLTCEELKEGLNMIGHKVSGSDVQMLMEAVSLISSLHSIIKHHDFALQAHIQSPII